MKLWKKVLAAVTAGMLCLGSVGASGVQSVLESVGTVLLASATVPDSYDGTYEDLYYKVTDAGEIEITGCKADATSVEIPAEIDGKSVTSIGNGTFDNCNNLIIRGYTGSFAETYAREHNIRFADVNATYTCGDLDGSDNIDSTDIFYTMLYIANVAVGNDGGLTAEQIAAADVDGNGTVDSTDSFYIMYYVALHGAGIHQTWEEVLAK